MSGAIDRFLAARMRALSPEKWDAFVRHLGGELADMQSRIGALDRVADQALQRSLTLIDEAIGPAIVDAHAKQAELANLKAEAEALAVQIAAILATLAAEGISADVVSETGTRLFLTPAERAAWNAKPDVASVGTMIGAAIDDLVGGAPGALDTIAELAAALGNNAGAVATLTASIAGKLSKSANLSDLTDVAAARTTLAAASTAALDALTAIVAQKAPLTGGSPQFETLRFQKSFTLGAAADLNALATSGWYDVANPVNGPGAGWFWVHCQAHSANPGDWRTQRAISFNDGREYRRSMLNGVWGSWVEVNPAGPTVVKLHDDVVTSNVSYVEHAVDFATYCYAVTVLEGVSRFGATTAAINVTLRSPSTSREALTDAGAYSASDIVSGTVQWTKRGLHTFNALAQRSFADVDRIRIAFAGSSFVDAGRITTYGVKF
jgi:hypothetical protein